MSEEMLSNLDKLRKQNRKMGKPVNMPEDFTGLSVLDPWKPFLQDSLLMPGWQIPPEMLKPEQDTEWKKRLELWMTWMYRVLPTILATSRIIWGRRDWQARYEPDKLPVSSPDQWLLVCRRKREFSVVAPLERVREAFLLPILPLMCAAFPVGVVGVEQAADDEESQALLLDAVYIRRRVFGPQLVRFWIAWSHGVIGFGDTPDQAFGRLRRELRLESWSQWVERAHRILAGPEVLFPLWRVLLASNVSWSVAVSNALAAREWLLPGFSEEMLEAYLFEPTWFYSDSEPWRVSSHRIAEAALQTGLPAFVRGLRLMDRSLPLWRLSL